MSEATKVFIKSRCAVEASPRDLRVLCRQARHHSWTSRSAYRAKLCVARRKQANIFLPACPALVEEYRNETESNA